MFLRDRSASGRRSTSNLLAEYFSSVFENQQLKVPDRVQIDDILIYMQIDEQELLSALYTLYSRLDANYQIDWNFAPDPGFIFLYLKSKKYVENPPRYVSLHLPGLKKPIFLIF